MDTVRPLVVACIPAFNEKRTIGFVRASRFVDRVVVCGDGPTDLTSEVVRCLGGGVVCELS